MIYKQVISKLPLPSTSTDYYCFNDHFSSIERENKRNIIKMNAYACANKNLFPLYNEVLNKDNDRRTMRHPMNNGRHCNRRTNLPYEPRRSSICFKKSNFFDQLIKQHTKHRQSNSMKWKKDINKVITDNTFNKVFPNPKSPIELIREISEIDINDMNEIAIDNNNDNLVSSNNIQVNNPMTNDNMAQSNEDCNLNDNTTQPANYHFKYPSMMALTVHNSTNTLSLNTNNNTFITNNAKKKYIFLHPLSNNNTKRGKSNDLKAKSTMKDKEKKLFERKIYNVCQGVSDQCQSLHSFLSKSNTKYQVPQSLSDEESLRIMSYNNNKDNNNGNDVMIEHLQSAKRRQKTTYSIHTHLYDNARAVKESTCLSKLNSGLALNANKMLKEIIFKRKSINKYKEYNDDEYKTLMQNHVHLYKTTMDLINKNQKAIKNIKTRFINYKVK